MHYKLEYNQSIYSKVFDNIEDAIAFKKQFAQQLNVSEDVVYIIYLEDVFKDRVQNFFIWEDNQIYAYTFIKHISLIGGVTLNITFSDNFILRKSFTSYQELESYCIERNIPFNIGGKKIK